MTEPLDCHACGRRIGRDRRHSIVRGSFVLCMACMEIKNLHAVYHPDCPVPWHDMFDHGSILATRGGANRVLDEQAQR